MLARDMLAGWTTVKGLPGTPNNLGPTLLIVVGTCIIPLGVGVPIVLFALAQLRTKDGHRTYAFLIPKFLPSLKVLSKA